jgi:Domain of unknown function (DUF6457)
MDDWLEQATERLAKRSGLDPAALAPTQADVDKLLDLARIAAHESGDRTNAPVLTYLAGLAQGRSGRALADLADAAGGTGGTG